MAKVMNEKILGFLLVRPKRRDRSGDGGQPDRSVKRPGHLSLPTQVSRPKALTTRLIPAVCCQSGRLSGNRVNR